MKAVIFDMDGVIIDSEPIYLQDTWKFAKTKNPEATLEQLFPMVGRTKQDAWMVLERTVDNGQTWEQLRDEFRSGTQSSPVDYREIFRPEVKTLLNQLKKEGYRLALASSTHLELVLHVLEVNEIKDYYDVIVSGSQFKESKPNPEIYHYTAKKLGVKENECLVLEDSTVGIQAAYAAGMTVAALIDTRFHFDQSLAHYQVNSVESVMDILKNA